MLVITIVLLALSTTVFFLMRQIWALQQIIKMSNEDSNNFKSKTYDLLSSFKKDVIFSSEENFKELKILILTLQADAIRAVSCTKEEEKKQPPANRKPRTEEQKEAAAQKRKEWWEKKRQEEKLSIPDAVAVIQQPIPSAQPSSPVL